MFFKYPTLACLFLIAFSEYGTEASYALAGISVVFASMFYWIVFQMVIGTKRVELLDNCDINHTWQGRVVHVAGVVALFPLGLIEAFYFALPFVIIGIMADILSTLIVLGIMEFSDEEE